MAAVPQEESPTKLADQVCSFYRIRRRIKETAKETEMEKKREIVCLCVWVQVCV